MTISVNKKAKEASSFSKVVIDIMLQLSTNYKVSTSIRMGQSMRTLIDGVDLHTKPMELKTKTTGWPPWAAGYIMWDQEIYGREGSAPIPTGGDQDPEHKCSWTKDKTWAESKVNFKLSTKKFLHNLADGSIEVTKVEPLPSARGRRAFTLTFNNKQASSVSGDPNYVKGYSKANLEAINKQTYSIEIDLDTINQPETNRESVVKTRPGMEYHTKIKKLIQNKGEQTKSFLESKLNLTGNAKTAPLLDFLTASIEESPDSEEYNRIDDLLTVSYKKGDGYSPLQTLPVTGDMDLLFCGIGRDIYQHNYDLLKPYNMSIPEQKTEVTKLLRTIVPEELRKIKRRKSLVLAKKKRASSPSILIKEMAEKQELFQRDLSTLLQLSREELPFIDSESAHFKEYQFQKEKMLPLRHALKGIGDIGNFLSAYVINNDHELMLASELEIVHQFFHHGAEVYNPGKPSDIDEPAFHIVNGVPVVTETENELIYLLLYSGEIPNTFRPINPKWVTKEGSNWYLLVEKQLENKMGDQILANCPEVLSAFIETIEKRNLKVSTSCLDNLRLVLSLNTLDFVEKLTNKSEIKTALENLKSDQEKFSPNKPLLTGLIAKLETLANTEIKPINKPNYADERSSNKEKRTNKKIKHLISRSLYFTSLSSSIQLEDKEIKILEKLTIDCSHLIYGEISTKGLGKRAIRDQNANLQKAGINVKSRRRDGVISLNKGEIKALLEINPKAKIINKVVKIIKPDKYIAKIKSRHSLDKFKTSYGKKFRGIDAALHKEHKDLLLGSLSAKQEKVQLLTQQKAANENSLTLLESREMPLSSQQQIELVIIKKSIKNTEREIEKINNDIKKIVISTSSVDVVNLHRKRKTNTLQNVFSNLSPRIKKLTKKKRTSTPRGLGFIAEETGLQKENRLPRPSFKKN